MWIVKHICDHFELHFIQARLCKLKSSCIFYIEKIKTNTKNSFCLNCLFNVASFNCALSIIVL